MTTGPVWPPMVRHSSIHSPNGTCGPTVLYVPVVPVSAQSSNQAARSRASITWVEMPEEPGTSSGACGSRAARATQ